MNLLKIAALVVISIGVIAILVRNTSKWAGKLQQYYIAQANKMYGNSTGWDQPWRTNLFKAIVGFFGFMFIIGAYSIIFSLGQ